VKCFKDLKLLRLIILYLCECRGSIYRTRYYGRDKSRPYNLKKFKTRQQKLLRRKLKVNPLFKGKAKFFNMTRLC